MKAHAKESRSRAPHQRLVSDDIVLNIESPTEKSSTFTPGVPLPYLDRDAFLALSREAMVEYVEALLLEVGYPPRKGRL